MTSDYNLAYIANSCTNECTKEGEGSVFDLMNLLDGYRRLINTSTGGRIPYDLFKKLALIIEPRENVEGGYRKANVDGSTSPRFIQKEVDATVHAWNTGEMNIDLFIYQLMQIRPMTGGNHRVSFVLRNFLSDTMFEPEPLPDYNDYKLPRDVYERSFSNDK